VVREKKKKTHNKNHKKNSKKNQKREPKRENGKNRWPMGDEGRETGIKKRRLQGRGERSQYKGGESALVR